jgi:hypothetical protein
LNDLTELAKLRTLVADASLTDEAKHSALWCLNQLPRLYAEFRRTDESRFYDAIGKLAQAVLKRLGEAGAGDAAAKVCEAVVRRLGEMHRRLAIAPLPLKTTASPAGKRRGRKAG